LMRPGEGSTEDYCRPMLTVLYNLVQQRGDFLCPLNDFRQNLQGNERYTCIVTSIADAAEATLHVKYY